MNVMIDIETMGTVSGCAIVSIAAVKFDPVRGRISKNHFYKELDFYGQELDYGLTINPDTFEWWEGRDEEVRMALNGVDDLKFALDQLSKYLGRGALPWGNGAGFDITILEHCYRTVGVEIPWKFWDIRDCRTALAMYNVAKGGLIKSILDVGGKSKVAHNALQDAIAQAKGVCNVYKELGLSK